MLILRTIPRLVASGFDIFFADGPVTRRTRHQPIVSLSTAESEFITASECVKEVIFLKNIFKEGWRSQSVFQNWLSAIHMIKTSCDSKRSKHIDVRLKFINEKVIEHDFDLHYCPWECRLDDIFTKSLNTSTFENLRKYILTDMTVDRSCVWRFYILDRVVVKTISFWLFEGF